jgi:hypothetical protein
MLAFALGKGFNKNKIMTMARDFQSKSCLRIKPDFGEKKTRAGPTPGKGEESKLLESSDPPMLSDEYGPETGVEIEEAMPDAHTPPSKGGFEMEGVTYPPMMSDEYGRETGVEIEEAMPDACTPSSARLARQGSFQRNEYGTGLEMEDVTYSHGSPSTSVADLQAPPTIIKQVARNIKHSFGSAMKSITKIRWRRNVDKAPPRNLNNKFDEEASNSSKRSGFFALSFYRRKHELVVGYGDTAGHHPSDSADSVETPTAKLRKGALALREALDSGAILDGELRLQLNGFAVDLLGLQNEAALCWLYD